MSKRIVLLGSGQEIDFILKNLPADIEIVAFGSDKSNVEGAKNSIAYCKEKGIPIIEHYSAVEKFKPDLIFMVSYPKLISNEYLNKYWFINVHGALIPKYRGIHGGTWAIINGEKYHGYSVHLVTEGIDNGPVYYQGKIEMDDMDDIFTIREKILNLFKAQIIKVIGDLFNSNLKCTPQDENEAIYVCKRKPEDGLINWNSENKDIFNLIRALRPNYTEGAFTFFNRGKLIIPSAKLLPSPEYKSINGQIVNFENKSTYIKCGKGYLIIEDVIYNGEHLNSRKIFKTVGHRLG